MAIKLTADEAWQVYCALDDALHDRRHGNDGGWLWGDPTPAWKKSDAFAEVKVLKAKGAKP